jgi:imidazolonepropionase-like amidohydrolase
MNNNMSSTSCIAFLTILLGIPTGARAERFVLRGATVHTVSGDVLSPGEVLVDGSIISAVGSKIDAGTAQVVELPKGSRIYPGLIAANTSLGLVEISAVRATRDAGEVGQYTPDVQSWIAVNPDSELIPVARANGITHAQPVPTGGVVCGQSGLIALAGWTTEQMTVKKPVGLHLTWPSMELDPRPREEVRERSRWKSLEDQARDRRAKIRELDEFFAEARAYAKGREAGADIVPAWEAMLPAIRGEIPVMVRADEIREIRAAIQWAQTNKYKAVIVGGRDAIKAADLLAGANVPVVFESIYAMPGDDAASYDVQFATPAALHKKGVKVILSEGGRFDATSARNLPYTAAQAVAFGLPPDEALKAITLYPAELFGVSDRLGSIATGKEASIIVTDGDILDIRTNVKRMWIAGKEASLESRHTRLYDKYQRRPKS